MRTDRGGKGGVIINVSSAAGKEPPISLTCLYDFVHLRKQKISLTLWKYLLYMNGLFWHNTNFNFDRDYYMYMDWWYFWHLYSLYDKIISFRRLNDAMLSLDCNHHCYKCIILSRWRIEREPPESRLQRDKGGNCRPDPESGGESSIKYISPDCWHFKGNF